MKLTEKQQKNSESLNALFTKYHNDETFKEKLINYPTETIKEVNLMVENNKNLVIEDQSDPNMIYFNIPAEPDLDQMELTDEDLEMVAGGQEASLLKAIIKILSSGGITLVGVNTYNENGSGDMIIN